MFGYIAVNQELSQKLIKAMTGEQDAREYYETLMTMTRSQEDRKIISKIMEDEKKHFNNFYRLYITLTGHQPILPPVQQLRISSYVEGIKKSIMDETDAYEFYRDIYLAYLNPMVRQIFLEAFTDENEHAIRLNYLYAKNK